MLHSAKINTRLTQATLLLAASSLFLTACTTTSTPEQHTAWQQCLADQQPLTQFAEHSEVRVAGVVQGVFQQPNQLGGFFINTGAGGVFVAASTDTLAANEGDVVRVSGIASPYYGGWQVAPSSPIEQCGTTAVTSSNISLPLSEHKSLSDYLLQRVTLSHDMQVIGHYQLARFGTLDIATERLYVPSQVEQPGPDIAVRMAHNNARRLVLDDGSWQENPEFIPYPNGTLSMSNPVRSGDTVRNIEGIVVRVGNNYHIHPVTTPQFIASNPRPEAPTLPEGDLRIVAFNVLNYFNGDGQGGGFPTPRGAATAEEFSRQRAKTIATMVALDADIYALMEMENDGFGEHSALADLTAGLNAAVAGSPFAFAAADAAQVGGDAITQAIIYRADRVTPLGDLTWTESGPFSWGSRPPLLQNFAVHSSGKEIAIVANHFKSKGSCPRDSNDPNANQNDGQACWNPLRTETANALAEWLASNPKQLPHENYVLLGDFNAYKMEDPIAALAAAGYPNLANYFAPNGYSYVFRGEMGSLDHVLVHESIWNAVQGMVYWHINADEPVAFEYPRQGKSEWQQEHFYAPSPYRSSDHDPIITVIDSAQLH